jgi:hypothetical protein
VVKFVLVLTNKKYNYKDEFGNSLTIDELYANLFNEGFKFNTLYLQLNWELADFIILDGVYQANNDLRGMVAIVGEELKNSLKSRGLKISEKTYLQNTIYKIKMLNFETGAYTAENLLAIYIVYSLNGALIKPFWFNKLDMACGSSHYNYSVMGDWLKNINKLNVYLENGENTMVAGIFWKKLFLKLINIFTNARLLEIKTQGVGQETQHFYKFKFQLGRVFNPLDFGFYLFRPQYFSYINKTYIQGLTFLSLEIVNKQNESSLKFFQPGDSNILDKLISNKLFLDANIFKKIKELLSETLAKLNLKFEELESLYFNYNFYLKNKLEINEVYRYLTFLKLEDFEMTLKNGFYFSYYFDFRGRVYYRGYASPQTTHIFRFCYHYGPYLKPTFPKNSKLIDIVPFINYIKKNTKLEEEYPQLVNLKLDYVIFWLFIELGKINKSEKLSENKWFLSWWDFIELGVQVFNNKCRGTEDLEKKICFANLIAIIENLNKNIINKYIIYKDSTASGIQLLAVMLGPKTDEIAQACNLNSQDFWFDAYSYIIYKFLSAHEVSTKFKRFFKRNFLKKTIMTYMYSATYLSLEKYFLTEVKKSFKETKGLDFENEIELKIEFKNFYIFLKSFFENKEFFEKSISEVINALKTNLHDYKEIKITASDGGQINLEYNKQETRQINIYIDNVRKTMKILKNTNASDFNQTHLALKPNAVHSLEANFARLIIMATPYTMITIHDCFGVSIFEVDELILNANTSINVIGLTSECWVWKPHSHYHSLFILV